jgi:hypothetical protein
MERLFLPCTRLFDLLESQGDLSERLRSHPEILRELNLDVSTEELLSAERAFTYADLYAMTGNEETVAWMTPHTAVIRTSGIAVHAWSLLEESCGICCSVDGEKIVAVALSLEHLLEICDVVLRLLAVSVVHSVIIDEWFCPGGARINAPALSYLMEQCQSLKV